MLIADFYWLSTIQYIGSNVLSSEYKRYLFTLTNLITDLSPHFTYPVQITLLLLPEVNERYETISKEEAEKHVQEALMLWEKTIRANCDMKKVEHIQSMYDLNTLLSEESLKNPCSDPLIPYYLAYVSYWNHHDPEKASFYYRLSAMNEDGPRGARIMSAIMQGKTGNREKSILMFLSLAENLAKEKNPLCHDVTSRLRPLLSQAFSGGEKLTSDFLKTIEKARKQSQEQLKEHNELIEKTDVSAYCSSYLNKAVREMNLFYLQEADKNFLHQFSHHARDAQELFEKGMIDFIPRDYQKGNDPYEMIYFYNRKIQNWDTQMGIYPYPIQE